MDFANILSPDTKINAINNCLVAAEIAGHKVEACRVKWRGKRCEVELELELELANIFRLFLSKLLQKSTELTTEA